MGGSRPESARILHMAERMESSTYTYWNRGVAPNTSSQPLFSPVQPKPVYKNDRAKAYWDVPVYAESTVVKSN